MRHLEGAIRDLIPNPQIFVTLRAEWASMLWSTLSGLNNEFDLQKNVPHRIIRGEGGSGWLRSRASGLIQNTPPPSYKQALLQMYFSGTVNGHNGSRAISKSMKWVPVVLCT